MLPSAKDQQPMRVDLDLTPSTAVVQPAQSRIIQAVVEQIAREDDEQVNAEWNDRWSDAWTDG